MSSNKPPFGHLSAPERADNEIQGGANAMRQIRIQNKTRRPREDRSPILPLDPRDPDIARAKQLLRSEPKDRERL